MHNDSRGRHAALRRASVFAALWSACTGCSWTEQERPQQAAPRIAIIDTSAYGPVLALHGPTPAGTLLVACSTRVLEFDPRDRSLRERGRIDAPFAIASGCFFDVPYLTEPCIGLFELDEFGGILVLAPDGTVHVQVGSSSQRTNPPEKYPTLFSDPAGPRFVQGEPRAEWIECWAPGGSSECWRMWPGRTDSSAPVIHAGNREVAWIDGQSVGASSGGPADFVVHSEHVDRYVNRVDVPRDVLGVPVAERVLYGCYDRTREAQRWFEHALDTGITREIDEPAFSRATEPTRHAEHHELALRGRLLLEQETLVGFSGAVVQLDARDATGALRWRDELRCDASLRPFPRTTGAIRIVEVAGQALAVLGHGSGLALYDLGPATRATEPAQR
jgi:hypothetical protein